MMMLRDQEFFFSNIYLIEALFVAVVVDGLGFIFAVWRIGLSFLHTGFISKRRLLQVLGYNYPFLFFHFVLHMVGWSIGRNQNRPGCQGCNAGNKRRRNTDRTKTIRAHMMTICFISGYGGGLG